MCLWHSNESQSQQMPFTYKFCESKWYKIGNVTIKISVSEKLLGIKTDNKLKLNAYVEDLCTKTSRKIHALARATPYMTVSKIHIFMNAFFISQFSYCPLL